MIKNLLPTQAYAFLQTNPKAVLIDCRMEIEHLYVGNPVGSVHVPWYEYPEFDTSPAVFAQNVLQAVGNDKTCPVVLICRSGQRTVPAAQVLVDVGFDDVSNVLHGFEGDLDEQFKRSTLNGWRFDGLPWVQM